MATSVFPLFGVCFARVGYATAQSDETLLSWSALSNVPVSESYSRNRVYEYLRRANYRTCQHAGARPFSFDA